MPRVKLSEKEKAMAEAAAKQANRQKNKERYEQRKRDGLCVNCGKELPLGWKNVQCQDCRDRQRGYQKKQRQKAAEKKAATAKKAKEAQKDLLPAYVKPISVRPNLLRRSCEFYVHEGPDGCSALKKRVCRGCSFYQKAGDL